MALASFMEEFSEYDLCSPEGSRIDQFIYFLNLNRESE